MAAPTPLEYIKWDGTRGCIRWIAQWTTGDQFADQNLIDLDVDLAPVPTTVKIRTIDIIINGNVRVDLEFDATTDQLIDSFEGQTDVTHPLIRDYTDCPNVGLVPNDSTAAGFTGDILLTTTGAADGDEVNLLITFERSS